MLSFRRIKNTRNGGKLRWEILAQRRFVEIRARKGVLQQNIASHNVYVT